MCGVLKLSLLALLLSLTQFVCAADDVSRQKVKGLDEQVQDIKKDVLGISSELKQLEEKLIYPSNTQVSVFVSMAPGKKVRLDAVDIRIDGKDVTHHVYTYKELEALKEGGVQRIYTGNVRSGDHKLEVVLTGKTSGNDDYHATASHTFKKTERPSLVQVALFGADKNINFKDR
ncbi:MAG: hypothetical protein R3292_06895 [Alcanivorax sp.]|nr:hypothetical protein [Alcanivorax sp.]